MAKLKSKFTAWLSTRWGNDFGHIVLGLFFMTIAGWLCDDVWDGWKIQAAIWYGREVAQYELSARYNPFTQFYKSLNPANWRGEAGEDGQRDLLVPVVFCAVVAYLWTLR